MHSRGRQRSASTLLAAAGSFLLLALPASAQSYTVLYPFSAPRQDASGLIQATDGNFYATTAQGGTNSLGSVFRMTSAGSLTTIYSFSGSDGQGPWASLVQGSDGDLYGTTAFGGAIGYGTVFKISLSGVLTTLYSFSSIDGSTPTAGLVQGIDGDFYGTTNDGGATGNAGTVFRITPSGTLTTLYSFSGSLDGLSPESGLVQGTDGDFYGTTNQGGTNKYGTFFKITPSGTLTTLYSFSLEDGTYPQDSLVQGTDGEFLGTTSQGSASSLGSVFKITPSGVLTTLYSFAGSDGAVPYSGLVQGTDGDFLGTTTGGGAIGYGTIFKITPSGVLTTLHSFSSSDGANPTSRLVRATDGIFYGAAQYYGPLGGGVIFRVTLGSGPAPTVTGVSPARGPDLGGTVVNVSGTEFQPGARVTIGGKAAAGVTFVSATTIYAVTSPHPAGAVTVSVTNPDLQSGSMKSAYTYDCTQPAAPTITQTVGTNPSCAGATATLDAGAGYTSYLWSTGATTRTIAVSPVTTTTYTVTGAVGACSSGIGSVTVAVSPIPSTPVLTMPKAVAVGALDWIASVPLNAGSTYAWAISNGVITAGQGTGQITFRAGIVGTPLTLSVTETNASGCVSAPGSSTTVVKTAGSVGLFYTLTPCRVLDTRNGVGPLGAPSLQAAATRTFDVVASSCGVPPDAAAISANLTVTNVDAIGELVVFPSDVARTNTSSISFRAGRARANNAIVKLSGAGADFSVFNNSSSTVDFIVDVNGFFR